MENNRLDATLSNTFKNSPDIILNEYDTIWPFQAATTIAATSVIIQCNSRVFH